MASSLTKTQNQSLIAWQDIASAADVIGTALSTSTQFACTVFAWLGRLTSSAFTSGSPNIRIEVSAKSSGTDDSWIPIVQFQPALGASIAATTANGAISAGATTCVVTSATNIAYGDKLFLGHTTTPANYEVVRVKSIASTTVTFEEACVNAHDTGCVISSQAEVFLAQIDLSAIGRIRAVVDNANSGQGIKVQVLLTSADSIG